MASVELHARAFGPDVRSMVKGDQLARVISALGDLLPHCRWACGGLDVGYGMLPSGLKVGKDRHVLVDSAAELAAMVDRDIQFAWGVFAALESARQLPRNYRLPRSDGHAPDHVAPALAVVRAVDSALIDVSMDDEAVLGAFGRRFGVAPG